MFFLNAHTDLKKVFGYKYQKMCLYLYKKVRTSVFEYKNCIKIILFVHFTRLHFL